MKILFCPSHYFFSSNQGSEIGWCFNLVDRLAQKNQGSVVVTGKSQVHPPYPVIEVQPRALKIDISIFNAMVFSFLYMVKSFPTILTQKFDIFHHVLPFSIGTTFNLGLIFSRLMGVSTVIGPIQNRLNYDEKNMLVADIDNIKISSQTSFSSFVLKAIMPVLNLLSNLTLISADKVIVINASTRDELIRRHIPAGKINIIPPGVDTSVFTKSVPARSRLKFVTASHLIPRKNLNSLVVSFAKARQKNPLLSLDIFGDGPEKPRLLALIKKLNSGSIIRVRDRAAFADMPKIYAQYHAYISYSYSEGFSTVALEAAASGLALFATRTGGFDQLIHSQKNGLFLSGRPDSDSQLLAGLSAARVRAFQSYSRRLAVGSFDWSNCIIPQYQAIYQSLRIHL